MIGIRRRQTWRNRKKCGNVRPPIAGIFMTRIEAIGREKSPRAQSLRISLMIGNARYAGLLKRPSGLWPGQILLRKLRTKFRVDLSPEFVLGLAIVFILVNEWYQVMSSLIIQENRIYGRLASKNKCLPE